MRVVIAGSRSIQNWELLKATIASSPFPVTEIVSGMAQGIDLLAVDYAVIYQIPWLERPAEWRRYGVSAGYIRNTHMLEESDALIAIWDGVSRGTAHSIREAKRLKKHLFVENTSLNRTSVLKFT